VIAVGFAGQLARDGPGPWGGVEAHSSGWSWMMLDDGELLELYLRVQVYSRWFTSSDTKTLAGKTFAIASSSGSPGPSGSLI
jgi:hypothetical protein